MAQASLSEPMQITPSQQKAIESVDTSVAIIAGAGSGKTLVLTERLLYLVQQKNLTLAQILCVTFTEKAAQEMKQRIAHGLMAELKKELPWAPIGTFHSFCLTVLREHGPLLGLATWLSVWDEPTAKLAIHRHCREGFLQALQEKSEAALGLVEALEFRNALALLEELMAFRWHWEKIEAGNRKQEAREERLFAATKELYQQILQTYEAEKGKKETLDFQDLEILTLKLLKENKMVLTQYQNRFAHILVDEAQDINDLQQELIELLFQPQKNCLCIVGDPKQSIYRFRGAKPNAFHEIVAKIKAAQGEVIELKENFRSRPALLTWINQTFVKLLDPRDYTELKTTREATSTPAIEVLPLELNPKTTKEERRKSEAMAIAQYIQTQVTAQKTNFGDFALLFQSLSDVRHYEAALRQTNIPYRLYGGRGFLSAQEVLDCLFCLKLMVNLEDRLALVGLMRSPLLGLPDTVITELALQHPDNLGQALLEHTEAHWLKEIYLEKNKRSAAEILEKVLLKTHYDVLLSNLDPSGAKLANLEQLITLIRELETLETMSLENLLEYFETLKKRQTPMAQAPAVDTTVSACLLMTIHAAKGLEFPMVILPDLIRSLPQDNHRYLFVRDAGLGFYLREKENPFGEYQPSQTVLSLKEKEDYEELNEKKRLLYVAMTRAQERLVLPIHPGVAQSGPWHNWIQEAAAWQRAAGLADGRPHGLPVRMPPEDAAAQSFSAETLVIKKPPPSRPFYIPVTDLEKATEPPPSPLLGFGGKKAEHHGAEFGNLVHQVLKKILDHSGTSLPGLVQAEAYNLALRYPPETIQETANLIENFLKSDIAPPHWQGLHEYPFRLKLGEVIITGIIDYLYETESGWIICDFKTDSQFAPDQYRLQMDVYALALSKAFEKPILETRLLFLKPDRAHLVPVTPERLNQTEENLIDFLVTLR